MLSYVHPKRWMDGEKYGRKAFSSASSYITVDMRLPYTQLYMYERYVYLRIYHTIQVTLEICFTLKTMSYNLKPFDVKGQLKQQYKTGFTLPLQCIYSINIDTK